MADQIETRRLGHGNDGGLGRAVNQHQRLSATAGLGCHVDDLTTMPLGDHLFGGGLHGEQCTRNIDCIELFICGAGDIDSFGCIKQCGVIDKDIKLAAMIDHRRDSSVDAGLIRHIHLHGIGAVAQGFGSGLRGLEVDVGNRDSRPFGDEPFGKAQPDPTRRTGDQCGFTSKARHATRSPWASNRWILSACGCR